MPVPPPRYSGDSGQETNIVSLRLFNYYSAICGAAGGLLGWAFGRVATGPSSLFAEAVQGQLHGLFIALALAVVETAAQLSLRQRSLTFQRLAAVSLLGATGGFLGGLCLHLLGRNMTALGLLIGWVLIGSVIGASSGLFDCLLCATTGQDTRGSRRRCVLGLLGGLTGGLTG